MAERDTELLLAAQGGDRAALEEVLGRHAPAVARFSMKMCRQRQDAEDVLQETLSAAAKALPEFRGEASLSTWLFTVARSFCIKKRRTSKFAPDEVVSLDAAEGSAVAADVPRPDDIAASRELLQALERALGELPPEQREVVLLRDVEGLSAEEAAKVVGVGVGALKSRLHRAREALKSRMDPWLSPTGIPAAPSASCPEIDAVFSRYLEGDIGPEQCAQMEEHVAACEACRASCDALKRSLSLCRTFAEAEVPPEIQQRVRRAILDLSASGL